MKIFSRSTSLCLLLLVVLCGCGTSQLAQSSCSEPLIQINTEVSNKFDLSLNIGKHHFSGMLIMREMKNGDIRIIGTTYFGLSLFDFSIDKQHDFHVNKCIEPLEHKKLLQLLERDFKLLLLPNQDRRLLTDTRFFKKFRKGSGFGKTDICVFEQGQETSSKIELRHPLIKLYIVLHPLLDN